METPKRLQPSKDTLRRLYTLSGNQCAYPGCIQPLINEEGNFVGQICHIAGAEPGGQRFNPTMTNEQRREYNNLMLMCYPHHIETNKVDIYPVHKLRDMKDQHEQNYLSIDKFVNQMQSSIIDVTSIAQFSRVSSLSNLYVDHYGSDHRECIEIQEDVTAFNRAIVCLSSFSPEAKQVFAISLSRAIYEKNYQGHETGDIYFDPIQVCRVIPLDTHSVRSIYNEIETTELIQMDTLDNGQVVFRFYLPGTESKLWGMIKSFCDRNQLDIVEIVSNVNFIAID